MATFYVPLERRNLPASDPKRWMIFETDTLTPVEAMAEASAFARSLATRGWSVWAAVRDIPSFEYMQMLRDTRDDVFGKRSKRPLDVAGYV